MLIEHRGRRPSVDPEAYVAPTAVICGAVRVGAGARILFGAVLTAEDGTVEVGERSIVMENALVRGRARHFLATGASLFPPGRHDDIWAIQEGLGFPETVYGVPRGTAARELMQRQSVWFGSHAEDRIVPE